MAHETIWDSHPKSKAAPNRRWYARAPREERRRGGGAGGRSWTAGARIARAGVCRPAEGRGQGRRPRLIRASSKGRGGRRGEGPGVRASRRGGRCLIDAFVRSHVAIDQPAHERSRVCNSTRGVIRKYNLVICRRCFRDYAKDIGFVKVRHRRPATVARVRYTRGRCIDSPRGRKKLTAFPFPSDRDCVSAHSTDKSAVIRQGLRGAARPRGAPSGRSSLVGAVTTTSVVS